MRKKKKNKAYSAVGDLVSTSIGLGVSQSVMGALPLGAKSRSLLTSSQSLIAAGSMTKSAKATMKELKGIF